MNEFINYFSDKVLITILKVLPICMDIQWLIIDKITISMIDDEARDFSLFNYREFDIKDEYRQRF